mmetsp:Transcript_9261/g.25194  ORF Transcript_9261/g.25194 Transcript_9261/m.25194 type:complete len:124 (-) Transcript_9261:1257-1628(-)
MKNAANRQQSAIGNRQSAAKKKQRRREERESGNVKSIQGSVSGAIWSTPFCTSTLFYASAGWKGGRKLAIAKNEEGGDRYTAGRALCRTLAISYQLRDIASVQSVRNCAVCVMNTGSTAGGRW